jgi:hypothetical protein
VDTSGVPAIRSFPLRENTKLLDLGYEKAECEAAVGGGSLARGVADWVVRISE